MLIIHGAPRSRAFRCIWAAAEAGLDHEIAPLPFDATLRAPEFLAVNPNGKVPALTDGDLHLFESLAINLHLATKAGAPLSPAGADGARVLQWTLWAATEAEPHAMAWARHSFMAPLAQRDPAAAVAARAALDTRLAVLADALADRPFLLGQAFSIADCNLAGVLYGIWFAGYPFETQPAVAAWLRRCLERPAARRARALREGEAAAAIDTAGFAAALRAEGFAAVELKTYQPGLTVPPHAHDFDVRALVLDGGITLTCGGDAVAYRPGDIFAMAAGRPHAEAVEAAGMRALVGRRGP